MSLETHTPADTVGFNEPTVEGEPDMDETADARDAQALDTSQHAPEDAAEKAEKQARVTAIIAAIVPTILAAQGMVMFAQDILKFPLPAAIALAGFLEMALIAAAMLDRSAAIRGRSSRGIATWTFSAVSGTLSALHEFVDPLPGGGTTWTDAPTAFLAGAIRIAAPLVAAYLWHRVLIGLRYGAEGRSVIAARQDKRLHKLARAAVNLNRADLDNDAAPSAWRRHRIEVARRRMDRAHDRVLQVMPATDPNLARRLDLWMRALAAADVFSGRASLETDAPTIEAAAHVETTRRRPAARRQVAAQSQRAQVTAGPAVAVTNASDRPAAAQPSTEARPALVQVGVGSEKEREKERVLALFAEAVAADPTTKPVAKELGIKAGATTHEGTVRRWVQQAWEEHIATVGDGTAERDQAQLEAEAAVPNVEARTSA